MMVFPTMYDARDRIFANPGSRTRDVYTAKVSHEGSIELEKTGEENLYDYIQSFAESCDINTIVKRYANGDVSALSKTQGIYDDLTNYPKTYAELLNTVIAGEKAFMELPLETRAKFNHDYRQWLVAMDDMPSWMAAMNLDGSVVSGQFDTDSVSDASAGTASSAESSSKGSDE